MAYRLSSLHMPVCVLLTVGLLLACSPKSTKETIGSDPDKPLGSKVSLIADQVFIGEVVYDGLTNQPGITNIAVRDGVIVGIGTADDIKTMVGPDTVTHALDGAYIYPGFTDAHAHLLGIGQRELILNLEGTSSIAQLVATVESAVVELSANETLYARGWIETGWPEGRFPNRSDIDQISPDHAVILERADGHAMLVNTKAMMLSGITTSTPDPSGGKIEKDANGEPTGILIDAAQGLVEDLLTYPTGAAKELAYETGASVYAAYGWTGLHNMSVNPDDVPIIMTMSMQVAPEGTSTRIPIRVYNSIDPRGLNGLVESGPVVSDNGRIITRAIKLYADGALGSRGAALFEPYTDRSETSGLVLIEPDEAISIFNTALRNGIQVNTHAIGDRGNRLVLDWYQQAIGALDTTPNDPRFRIEHAQIVRQADIPLFRETGLIASMQPSHAIGDLFFAPDRLGTERLNGAYAWQSMIDAGVIVAGGSDAPVERGDPRIEFYAAVARRGINGFQTEDWHAEQAVSRAEALKMFTMAPAIASFQEEHLGSIEVGKRADFTIFAKDIMTIPAEQILTVDVVMTVVDGVIVYQHP